ncbi:MAG: patatin-like phospholipase family protein [Acidobacteriota bacterium]
MPDQRPLPLYEMLEEEYVSLHGVLPDQHYSDNKTPDERLKAIYNRIHALDKKRAALCISGGGIRSATFALGVVQSLARLKLLKEFDYLSTVSGGGYVGSWLSAWIHRDPKGTEGVFNQLKDKPKSALEPEPRPIRHLRAYSNYLTPRLGLLSADTWTLVATVARNLILNWTVFLPLMLAALLVPRFCVSLVRVNLAEPTKDYVLTGLLLLAFILGVISVVYMGVFRPSNNKYREKKYKEAAGQPGFLKWCLVPTLGMTLLLSIYWGWLRNSIVPLRVQTSPMLGIRIEYPWAFLLFGFLLYLVAWIVASIWLRRISVSGFVTALVVGFAGGIFLWLAATRIFPKPVYDANNSIPDTEIFVCFALPLLLVFLLLAVTLFVGLASRRTSDEDREWLARFGAWVLIGVLVWSLASSLVIFGPYWLLKAGAWAQAAVATAGGIAGLITIIFGRSSKTAANDSNEAEGKQSPFRSLALALAAPVFVLIVLVGLSLATSGLIALLKSFLAGKRFGIEWHLDGIEHASASWDFHMIIVHNTPLRVLALIALVLLTIGLVMSVRININKFSLHSMYRNRIIRAYLGASREKRTPNPFTGFDPDDNLPIHQLRSELLHAGSLTDPTSLMAKLKDPANPVSQYLKPRIDDIRKASKPLQPDQNENALSPEALTLALNEVLDGPSIYEEKRFAGVSLDAETRTLLGQKPTGSRLVVLNRLLLEQAYQAEITSFRSYKPLHVVNMALNLVAGENLAWQQRKAESFTSSPLHSGCYCIGDPEQGGCGSYRRSKEYGDGISLGTAVAISGAAVSPNMGYHSSAAITFLLTLFNARLGWWLGNPGRPGQDTYPRSGPLLSIRPLLAEAFGLTDDKNKYIYLSDGGHFENLAIYEMVLRRCHHIVVSDGSQDPECAFDDLGAALRKIRIDMGVPITIGKIIIYSRKSDKLGKYCAVGKIRYSEVDGGGPENDGTLIYIKPAICGGEPADVFNYAQQSKLFPHESTGDQFFSETQFESYRMLGLHSIQQISEGWTGATLEEWAHQLSTVYLA